MSTATQFSVKDITLSGATEVRITNKNIPTANTEVSHSLIAGLKKIIIRVREIANLKVAFVATESETNFATIPKGATLTLDDLGLTGKTLYMQSPTSPITVEVIEFY